MSRISVKSKDSSARSLTRRKRRAAERARRLKPVDFCCTAEDFDPLTIYNQRKPPFTSSLTAINTVQECPVMKFRTNFMDPSSKKLAAKGKDVHFGSTDFGHENLAMSSMNGPIQWYLEEELALAKDIFWEDRLLKNIEETRKNIRIGRKKVQAELKQMTGAIGPRWYQDFSISQMRNLIILEDAIRADYKQMVTGRTQKTLIALGVVSTYFTIDPKVIRRMQRSCEFKAIDFLREAYRLLTGNYFEDEGYKKSYDCNERIILSGIAFLTLPETILELHKRLPPVAKPQFPPKPVLTKVPPIQKMSSPYQEKLFTRPDWSTYLNRLQDWRDICKRIPIPKMILPTGEDLKHTYKEKLRSIEFTDKTTKGDPSTGSRALKDGPKRERGSPRRGEKGTRADGDSSYQDSDKRQQMDEFDIPRLPDENQVFDFTLSGLSEKKSGPVKYKICGTLHPPRENKKSWLGEKDAHFVITGVSDDPPQCPVTYEMTGVANVTPTNSNERFFTILKIGDGPKKIYPSGRKNLSKVWQEWLLNADEEFMKVEREANKILKSVEATMRLVFPGPTCDSCCSCRQTRRTDVIRKQTKAPYMVIDTLTQDEKNQKYIVGSMALHSPAPTPHESTVNLLEIIASEDKIVSNVVINGVTTEKGEKKYYITGMKDETIRIPSRRVEPPPPLPPKNVPPCSCAIQQMFNLGVTPKLSTDNIPWTKDEGQCFGKKYRPEAAPAYSCKSSPGDKSCRLNPFLKDVAQLERKKREKKKSKADYYMKGKKNLYSIADFKPCGDEHGMSICGGPWGATHVLSPQELAELEKQRKEILKGPPCGTRPGRAVCGGPFGERIPEPKKARIKDDDDDEDDEDEEEVVLLPTPQVVKKKVLRRGTLCHASPESIAASKQLVKKKVTKFIPDPDYPGYDDPWNVFRTAPSVKETETEYEKSLKLSSPKARSDKPRPIREIMKKRTSSKGADSLRSLERSAKIKGLKMTQKMESKRGGLSMKPSSDKTRKETRSRAIKSATDNLGKRSDRSLTQKKLTGKRPSSSSPKRKEASPSSRNGSSARKKTPSGGDNLEKKSGITTTEVADPGTTTPGSSPERKKRKASPKKSALQTERVIRENKSDTTVKTEKSDARKREKEKRVSGKDGNGKRRKEKKSAGGKKRGMASASNLTSPQDKKPKKKAKKESGKTREGVAYKTKSNKRTRGNQQISSRNKAVKSDPMRGQKFSKPGEVKRSDKKKSKTMLKDFSTVLLPEEEKQQEVERLKNMMKSPDTYPYEVEPIILPKEPPAKCKHEYGSDDEKPEEKVVSKEAPEEMQVSKKGPCGWRTKSEQELPVKKTMAYLVDPDPPLETIAVRPGGRACVCRENRNKKKILMYQIGGSIEKKKAEPTKVGKLTMKKKEEEEDRGETRVIEGVIYYTPPPSRRRSDEYVPEYDLYESPYDMCTDRRKDSFMNLLEKYSAPRDVMANVRKTVASCDCSGYMDTFGVVGEHADIEVAKRLLEEREQLMELKEPKERWDLALKDKGLMDYYAGCKHKLPCWTTCKKLNKYACRLQPRRLRQKKPVCECKYERKIVEKKEEKIKWRERRDKLRTFKKKPFLNVTATSRPMEADTKLIISGVKRIPREDEYIDDIEYCISGIAENYTMGPVTQVVDGLNMSTPFHTPEPSKEKIPCVCLHSHWSQSNIPPGPLPRKDEALIKERERREKYLEEAAKLIYGPRDDTEESQKWYRSCQAKCDPLKVDGKRKKVAKTAEEKDEQSSSSPTRRHKSPDEQKDTGRGKRAVKTVRRRSVDDRSPSPQRTVVTEKKVSRETNEERQTKTWLPATKTSARQDYKDQEDQEDQDDQEDKEIYDGKTNLSILVKVELQKMAEEGFLFAKLPNCYRMPQLQNWIMYRKGFVLTDEVTDKLMRLTFMTWEMANVTRPPKIVTPTLGLSKKQIRDLTFDVAEKMKKKILMKNTIFYSQLRKSRVLYSRYMWSTMEFRRYPSIPFKQAYFAYMAGKEADGHVFKPWMINEVRERE
ncbi:hypothetical protein KPH14_007204 [Odynerus spinipes]|uniref:Uncharacterized protein n=1 Tax=Odynerus spinipes TaxID=1348599 RepID=A0AAD9RB73_9HYME|nr:hypothetical protein KPH14_007204 [Odynerus spinipes]